MNISPEPTADDLRGLERVLGEKGVSQNIYRGDSPEDQKKCPNCGAQMGRLQTCPNCFEGEPEQGSNDDLDPKVFLN